MKLSLRVTIALILALTAYRIVMLHFDGTDLFVDEAQYWQWSQHLDFGYYSKPPMIAWVIHLFTTLGGSSDIFWIRLASPLLHMATALILIPATARLTGSKEVANWTAISYATLPGVALSSVFMSTDTVLFPCLAITLYAYSHLIERRAAGFAVLVGVAIGFGTLAKYAMLYFVATAAIAAIFIPRTRIALRDCLFAAIATLLVIFPNIWWNATHGGATLKHTSENADWHGLNFKLGKALEFFSSQFGVVGPVLFAAMIVVFVRLVRGRAQPTEKHLFILSWPIVLAIVFQALMSRAYANWAATAYAAGTMLAVFYLFTHSPRWLRASLVINTLAALLFPLMTVLAQDVRLPNGKPVLARYLGRAELSRQIGETATRVGAATIVADNRDILADLFHTLRNEPYTVLARTQGGFPRNYYEQTFPLTSAKGDDLVLYVTAAGVLSCHGVTLDPVADLSPRDGYLAGRRLHAFALPASCLTNLIG
ncbi:ArnT family glycosyltransferase [Allorhizobium undicola]|uniref:ArnT family glycosyltransferase n=1 Tax=Allorhizobium undicola TaxID=78527 RepID=UPI00048992D3|nr:glycosyltransferase family 39 protein [Allorhizobium undicola]